jgi:hypothetical protein
MEPPAAAAAAAAAVARAAGVHALTAAAAAAAAVAHRRRPLAAGCEVLTATRQPLQQARAPAACTCHHQSLRLAKQPIHHTTPHHTHHTPSLSHPPTHLGRQSHLNQHSRHQANGEACGLLAFPWRAWGKGRGSGGAGPLSASQPYEGLVTGRAGICPVAATTPAVQHQ